MSKQEALQELCQAAERGDLTAAQAAIDAGAPLNGRLVYGKTPMMFAIENLHPQMMTFLKSKGARINMLDEDGEHPLIYAFSNERISTQADGTEITATRNQQMNTLRVALLLGADKDARSELGTPAIDFAANQLAIPAIIELVAMGLRVDLNQPQGNQTVLHLLAARKEKFDPLFRTLINLCVQGGADPSAVDEEGRTPAAMAEQAGNTQLSQYLAGLTPAVAPEARRPRVR